MPTIKTSWGDARAVRQHPQSGQVKYDLIFGDAFNDFSVPWHLTTREFNDKVGKMLEPGGVYMINIIDLYESDATVEEFAARRIKALDNPTPAKIEAIKRDERIKAMTYTGFLGSWVKTARKTFKNVYIYGTDNEPGSGLRETFVVVVTNADLDLDALGGRDDDPKFFSNDRLFQPKAYSPEHMKAVEERANGIILTDDYAPVENLLAPVAETRGKDD